VAEYKRWCTRNNVKAVLYEENLGKALKKWVRKQLVQSKMDEAEIVGWLGAMRKREGQTDVTVKKRKMKYHGIHLVADPVLFEAQAS
jgi:hypothetical protein